MINNNGEITKFHKDAILLVYCGYHELSYYFYNERLGKKVQSLKHEALSQNKT